MEEFGLESLEKAVRRVGRDPVEAARDSSCCRSWDDEPCSVDDEAPISLSFSLSTLLGRTERNRRRERILRLPLEPESVVLKERCFVIKIRNYTLHRVHQVTCAPHRSIFHLYEGYNYK